MVDELGRTHPEQLEALVEEQRAGRREYFTWLDHRVWCDCAAWELKILKMGLRRIKIVRRLRRLYGSHR